jgi:hypothetical protein
MSRRSLVSPDVSFASMVVRFQDGVVIEEVRWPNRHMETTDTPMHWILWSLVSP